MYRVILIYLPKALFVMVLSYKWSHLVQLHYV